MIGAIWGKVRRQTLKDYVLFPLLSGPSFPLVLAGNLTANLTRNLWAFTIIFCGHFPDGTEQFSEQEAENETRAEWYYRQLLGSANLTGGRAFHVLAGNLSHPDRAPPLPGSSSPPLRGDLPRGACDCERYGIPYNTGPLAKQFGSVVRKIFSLGLPPRGARSTGSALPAQTQPAALEAVA